MSHSRAMFHRRALKDALSLFLVPIATALLPWRAGFALLKVLSRRPWLYRESVDGLWRGAAAFFPEADETEWKRRARLLLLVEHADNWLALLRGERWWRRHVALRGELPAPGRANLLLTYHWGAGNWVWPILRAHGIGAYFLARRPHGRALGLSRVSHWYGRLRAWSLRRMGSSGVIFTGDSSGAIRQALARGDAVVGMLDVGARDGQQGVDATLLGRSVRLPFGLVRLAAESAAPVTLFSVGLDVDSGARDLVVQTLPANATPAQVMDAYARHLDERLRAAPEAWQMWHEAHAMFAPPARAQAL